MKFFSFALLALSASALSITSKNSKMSDKDIGEAMNDIGKFVDEHLAEEGGSMDFDDLIGVCDHLAKEHGMASCPKVLQGALKEAFKGCDANGDGIVTLAEFHKCYDE